MKAFVPSTGIDVFVGDLSAFQTVFVAIAALATGGTAFILPVTDSGDYLTDALRWLGPSDFINPELPIFLAATGINDSPILKGIRQHDRACLSTESLLLDTASCSIELSQRFHNLDKMHFPRPKTPGSSEFEMVGLNKALDDLNGRSVKEVLMTLCMAPAAVRHVAKCRPTALWSGANL